MLNNGPIIGAVKLINIVTHIFNPFILILRLYKVKDTIAM